MPYKLFLLAVLLTTLLVGCSSTGGTIGGLIPAPKFTKGELEGGVYTAQDNSFVVNSPFEPESYAYRYMEIQEDYTERENRVQFSSSAAPAEVYRINLFKNITPEENIQEVALAGYRGIFEEAYETPFENHERQYITVSGLQAIQNTYSQHVPERQARSRTAAALNVIHTCVYLEKQNNAAFICSNRPEDQDSAFAPGTAERMGEFVSSFQLK